MNIFRRKRNIIGSAALTALLALSALAPTGLQARSATNVKLVFWYNNDPSWIAAYQHLTAAYTKMHPNVTFTTQTYGFTEMATKLETVIGTSAAPDVVGLFGTFVTPFARANQFDPVPSSLYTPKQIQATYFAAATSASLYNGQYYSLPHEYNVENDGMLVNPAAFKAAGIAGYPTTWSQLTSDAAKLTVTKNGSIKRAGFLFTSAGGLPTFFLALILQQAGGHYFAADNVHVNFQTPQAATAMQAMIGLQQYGNERDFPVSVLDVSDYFFRGQAAMAFRGPWTIAVGQKQFPKMKFDYVTVPSYNSAIPPYFAAESGWQDAVTAASKNKAVAWDFVGFMNNKANDVYWNDTTTTIPARQDIANDPSFQAANPLLKPTLSALKYGRWVGPIQDRTAFYNGIRRYCVKVFAREMSIPQALTAMTNEINHAIDLHTGSNQ